MPRSAAAWIGRNRVGFFPNRVKDDRKCGWICISCLKLPDINDQSIAIYSLCYAFYNRQVEDFFHSSFVSDYYILNILKKPFITIPILTLYFNVFLIWNIPSTKRPVVFFFDTVENKVCPLLSTVKKNVIYTGPSRSDMQVLGICYFHILLRATHCAHGE